MKSFYVIYVGAILLTSCVVLNAYSWWLHVSIKPECEYVLPSPYKLTYSEKEHKYAIKYTHLEGWFLAVNIYEIDELSASTCSPEMFRDSCQAKAFCKKYWDNAHPDFK